MQSPDDLGELGRFLKALSAEARLRIVEALRGRCLCVKALAARVELTHSAVSQHLRILKDAGLVRSEKRGYWVHYSLDKERVDQARKRVDKFLDV